MPKKEVELGMWLTIKIAMFIHVTLLMKSATTS